MKVKIEEKQENLLLKRQDITFLVEHGGTPTPPRLDIRDKLAALMNCKTEQLYIVKLQGLYGQSSTRGLAHLYTSKEEALVQEQPHIIKRHMPEEAVPAAPAPPPPAEEAEPAPKEKEKAKPPKEETPKEKKEAEKPPKKEKAPKIDVKPPKEEKVAKKPAPEEAEAPKKKRKPDAALDKEKKAKKPPKDKEGY